MSTYLSLFSANNVFNEVDIFVYDRQLQYNMWGNLVEDFKINDKKYKFIYLNNYMPAFFSNSEVDTDVILCVDSLTIYDKYKNIFNIRFMLPKCLEEINLNEVNNKKNVYVVYDRNDIDTVTYMRDLKQLQNKYIIEEKLTDKYDKLYLDLFNHNLASCTKILRYLTQTNMLIIDGLLYTKSLLYKELELYKDFLNISSTIINEDIVEYDISQINYNNYSKLKSIPSGYIEKYITSSNVAYDINVMLNELLEGCVE